MSYIYKCLYYQYLYKSLLFIYNVIYYFIKQTNKNYKKYFIQIKL